jgi:hypothetical protein
VVLGIAAVLGFCVVVWPGFGWYLFQHSTRVDALVTLVNLAGDCLYRGGDLEQSRREVPPEDT